MAIHGSGNMNKNPLENIQRALAGLRRERDNYFQDKKQAEERLRLALEEEEALAKIVTEMKQKHEMLLKNKNSVQESLEPLETNVKQSLTEKATFQHKELVGTRTKINQANASVAKATQERQANLHSIRQLAHYRGFHVNSLENKGKALKHDFNPELRKEILERETNCHLFEWNPLSKLLEEKANMFIDEATRLDGIIRTLNQELEG